MPALTNETIGQIAAKDFRKADIFRKYGLDFCCGGKKTVQQACEEKGIDAAVIELELSETERNPSSRPLPYNEWSPEFLADYIVNVHHGYVKKTLPVLRTYAAKVADRHGNLHSELIDIYQLVEKVNLELTGHMMKEERMLFPFIKQQASQPPAKSEEGEQCSVVRSPINMMEHEHEVVGRDLEKIRLLTDNYNPPANSCNSFKFLYKTLEEFEQDLHLHVHLENNILFPKALERK